MKFECPQCSQRLAAEAEMVGHQIACPACANLITIPAPQVAAQTASPVPAPENIVPLPEKKEQPVPAAVSENARVPRRRLPRFALAAAFVIFGAAVAAFFIF